MITVRQAKKEDLTILLEFEQELIQAELPMDETLKREKTWYYNFDEFYSNPNIELSVAEIDGQIVGSGYAKIVQARECFQYNQYAYFGFMFTRFEYRGKGVNKAIIEYLYDWSMSKGVYEVQLTVYPDNPPAIRAYEKAGIMISLHTMRIDLRNRK